MVLLVRFGELALKSPYVRRQLRDRLVANIQDLFAAQGVECLTRADHGRIYVEVDDVRSATGILRRAFGVVSFSDAVRCDAKPEVLADIAAKVASARIRAETTFAVRARRYGSHTFTSQDVARSVGTAIQKAIPGAVVNLGAPQVEVFVEVRENAGFVFTDVVPGPGGLPLGSQGPAIAVVDGPRGVVGAWMAMKRGCRVTAAAPTDAVVEPLRRWDVHLKVLPYQSGENLATLVRLARAKAVFLGSSVGDLPDERADFPVPVFHPTVGLGDDEVHTRLRAIASA